MDITHTINFLIVGRSITEHRHLFDVLDVYVKHGFTTNKRISVGLYDGSFNWHSFATCPNRDALINELESNFRAKIEDFVPIINLMTWKIPTLATYRSLIRFLNTETTGNQFWVHRTITRPVPIDNHIGVWSA